MAKYLAIFSVVMLLLAGCSAPKRGIFAKRTPHEQYAARLSEAGLRETALGAMWFAASAKALLRPLTITLPYRETGYFAAEKPDAAGYVFDARRGELLDVTISIKPNNNIRLFADLWQPAADNASPSLLASADTLRSLQYEVERDGRYIIRIQPELLYGVEYTINITARPSLAFPVPGRAGGRIGSFWGDSRDMGTRGHEGVDIFGKFRTPVIAAADGYITRTGENNLGGKVVFLQPENKNYSLYYAHLDSQLVTPGQDVSLGDTLGLMGNTGNARNTPTHLHFGIYTRNGAVDPLPFIKSGKQTAPPVTASLDMLPGYGRNTRAASIYEGPSRKSHSPGKLPVNQVMRIIAAAGSWYKVVLPDSSEGFIESSVISAKPYKTLVTASATQLLDAPDSSAAVKRTIPPGTTLPLLGIYKGYYFTGQTAATGWLRQ